MKITHKDFLAEQAKLGKKVPKIYEDVSIGPNGEFNDDANQPDFQDWDNTDIAGMRMESLLNQMLDEVIDDIKREVTNKFGQSNPKVEKQMARMIADLWTNKINTDFVNLQKFNEGFNPQDTKYAVEFEGDFLGTENEEYTAAANWKFNPVETVTLTSVDGTINDERSNLDFELSNGTQLNFSCYFSVGPTDPRQIKEFAKLHIINGASHDVKDLYMQNLENYGSVILAVLKTYESITSINEGFFGDIKNKVMGTVEYNAGNNYAGSPEAQKFVTSDRRSKIQIDTLTKKGMTPEEAKSAVMYVFDKSGKNPLGFMGKTTEYNPQTKTLKVTTGGMNSPSLMA